MAQNILMFGLEKLTSAEVTEILFLGGVSEQVEMISLELSWIQFFLEHALRKKVRDVSHWESEIRDVTYCIEDVIDTTLITVSDQKNSKMFKTSRALSYLRAEINQIHETVMEISKRIKGVNHLGDGALLGMGSSVVVTKVDDPQVVGFEEDIRNIVEQLLDNRITRRSVVSILGTGGLGKTRLAQKAYNSIDVRTHFDYMIWVNISQNFRLTNLLRTILEDIETEPNDLKEDKKLDQYLLGELNKFLIMKKYLIVLDGVWTDIIWTQINGGLPDANNGSRVLITTRFENVATKADPESKPYKLKFLAEKPSLNLLLKKAIPNKDPEGNLDDLSGVAELLVKKCGGLPLALEVLGDLLSIKPRESDTWRTVAQTMNWHTDGGRCIDTIGTSYQILPSELKSCFMYFTSFPDDCEIDAQTLVFLWIREGFIPQLKDEMLEGYVPLEGVIPEDKGNKLKKFIKPELTAAKFLEHLVQRCMVEVIKRDSDGAIQSCQVHPVLLSLAMNEAKEKGFIHYDNEESKDRNSFGARRLAFHHTMMRNPPNLHKGFKKMNYLKHLSFRNSGMLVEIPETIGLLENLETLDVRGTFVEFLPESLWEITNLISVRASDWIHLDGPPSRANKLKKLQILKIVHVPKTWGENFPNLSAVKKLGLSYFRNPKKPNGIIDWNLVIRFLGKLSSLESLKIQGKDIPAKIIDAKTSPSYEHITRFWLGGSRSQFDLVNVIIPQSLVMLTLESLEFKKDPMPELEKLPDLKTLRLRWLLLADGKMLCSADGFPQLERLELYHISGLKKWSVQDGGMLNIKGVLIECCNDLKELPNLPPAILQVKYCALIKDGEKLLE